MCCILDYSSSQGDIDRDRPALKREKTMEVCNQGHEELKPGATVAAQCEWPLGPNRFSHAAYRLLLARMPTACRCSGHSGRRIPPVPIRTPERSSRLGGQGEFYSHSLKTSLYVPSNFPFLIIRLGPSYHSNLGGIEAWLWVVCWATWYLTTLPVTSILFIQAFKQLLSFDLNPSLSSLPFTTGPIRFLSLPI